MSSFEQMRGKALLQNLNNARIRYSQSKQTGAADVKALAGEVAYLQAMWREHLKKYAFQPPIPLTSRQIPQAPIAA